MSESTRLGRARGKMLPVSIVAAALIAMLVIVPLASAATPNPISSGSTTITLKSSVTKSLKKAGAKISAVKPAKIKGSKITLPVTGGEVEATTGKGTIAHGGGLKIKAGKKTVAIKSISVNSKSSSVSAKVGGKTVKLATLAGVSATRSGFGNSIVAKKLKLTSAGAKALNKALAPKPTKGQKKAKAMFKANTVLGGSSTQAEPETDNVLSSGNMTFVGDTTAFGKLAKAGVTIETIAPTTLTGTTAVSPLNGGTISPAGTTGTVTSSGGLKLTQKLTLTHQTHPEANTSITLGSIGVDLAAKTASVEVIGESTFVDPTKLPKEEKPLNLGNLGRSSIADLTITATPSPATRSVSITANGTIQPVAAEVLNGFVKVHQVKRTEELAEEDAKKAFIEAIEKSEPITEEEAQKIGEKKGAEEAAVEAKALEIHAGEALGTYSFVAQGE
jgi:hypothetical protein